MNIALLNTRITIQKNTVVTDKIGNHKTTWTDFFSCYATINSESGSEVNRTAETLEQNLMAITVRYCPETAEIGPTTHRILLGDDLYNITAVDHMNYKRKSLKIWCQKVRR